MAGESTLNQLKVQMDVYQAENKAVQRQLDEKMGKLQFSIDSLSTRFYEQMAWMKQQLGGNYGSSPISVEHKEVGIKEEHKNIEKAVLKHKEKILIDVSNQLNSKVSKVGSVSSMLLNEDFGEGRIEKFGNSSGNSSGIVPTKEDYEENINSGVLNPLGNGSVLVQRLLYSRCSNYNAKEPLYRGISKLVEHGTIAIEVNDSTMNSESEVTIEEYIIKALQGRGEFRFVHDASAVLFINNMSLTSYMKMQLIVNIRIFFPIVFDLGGVVGLEG